MQKTIHKAQTLSQETDEIVLAISTNNEYKVMYEYEYGGDDENNFIVAGFFGGEYC